MDEQRTFITTLEEDGDRAVIQLVRLLRHELVLAFLAISSLINETLNLYLKKTAQLTSMFLLTRIAFRQHVMDPAK